MRVIVDRTKLRRRAAFAHGASLGGLLILLTSVAVSFLRPEQTTAISVLLVSGFAVSVVGIYLANRWVKRPRPEDVLARALRSLSDQHRLYHYALPCDHVLLAPEGVVAFEVSGLEGEFSYREGRWRRKITPGRALRFLVEERLGNPIERAEACARYLEGRLAEGAPGGRAIPVFPVVAFTHPGARLDVEGAPIPVHWVDKKLARRIPTHGREKLPNDLYQHARTVLDGAARLGKGAQEERP